MMKWDNSVQCVVIAKGRGDKNIPQIHDQGIPQMTKNEDLPKNTLRIL